MSGEERGVNFPRSKKQEHLERMNMNMVSPLPVGDKERGNLFQETMLDVGLRGGLKGISSQR